MRSLALALCMIVVVVSAGCGLISRLEKERTAKPVPEPIAIAFICHGCRGNIPAGPVPLEMVLYADPIPQSCLWKINGIAVGHKCVLGYTFAEAGEYRVELVTEGATVQMLVIAYDLDTSNVAVVTADGELVSCTQLAPREIRLNTKGIMRVDCLAKHRLDYIYYRADIGLCLLWEDENESMALNIPAGAVWSFTYIIYGVAEGTCTITGTTKTASARHDETITIPSTITVKHQTTRP